VSAEKEHVVSILVGRTLIENWTDYSIESSMLEPADGFNMSLGGGNRKIFETVAPDAPVQVLIDDTPILTGFIDDRKFSVDRQGTKLTINGRDKGGRLTDESAPLLSFNGLGIEDLARAVVGDWFPEVSLSNATNRRLVRGKGARLAKVSKEPAIDKSKRAPKKVEPGETRWQVMAHFLEEADLLAWSSANGRQFIVGLPNYEQEPQFRFFLPKEGSDWAAEGNVESIEIDDSVGERYSMIVACGAGKGDTSNYSARVTKRRGEAKNNPNDPNGVGVDFTARKCLLVSDDDVRDEKLATTRALREMAERDSGGRRISVTVKGHAQSRDGKTPALYCFDTVAVVEVEELGILIPTLITGVSFEHSRDGERATIEMVPKGTVLRL
jgi:prophage tail gpP-like protein